MFIAGEFCDVEGKIEELLGGADEGTAGMLGSDMPGCVEFAVALPSHSKVTGRVLAGMAGAVDSAGTDSSSAASSE